MRLIERLIFVARTDLDGSFKFPEVYPGEYLVFAWPNSESYQTQLPEVFAQLAKAAKKATLERGSDSAQELTLTHATESLAGTLTQ